MQEEARSQEEVAARLQSWRYITLARERRCLSCGQPLPWDAELLCPACRAVYRSSAARASKGVLRRLYQQHLGELDPQVVALSIKEVENVVTFFTKLLRPYPRERLVPTERLREIVQTLRRLVREQPWLNDFPYHIDRFPFYTAELVLWDDPKTECVALSPEVTQRVLSYLLPILIEVSMLIE